MPKNPEETRGNRTGRKNAISLRVGDELLTVLKAQAEREEKPLATVVERLVIAGMDQDAAERRHQEVMAELRAQRASLGDVGREQYGGTWWGAPPSHIGYSR